MNRKSHLVLIAIGLLLLIYMSFSGLYYNPRILAMVSSELFFTILINAYMGVCFFIYTYRKRYKNSLESSFFITILIVIGLPVGVITILNILSYY